MINYKLPAEELVVLCKKFKIRELSVFGSILREDFNSFSDIDFLYVFDSSATYSLLDMVKIVEEFEILLGRSVDFVSRLAVEQSANKYRKQAILENREVIYS